MALYKKKGGGIHILPDGKRVKEGDVVELASVPDAFKDIFEKVEVRQKEEKTIKRKK